MGPAVEPTRRTTPAVAGTFASTAGCSYAVVRAADALPPRDARVVLADQVARLRVRVPVLGEPVAARGDGLRLQRRRPRGRPRGRHLRRDDGAQVLLERHLVHRAVLAGGAVHRTDRTAVRPHPARRLAHRGQVGEVGAGRRVGLRADRSPTAARPPPASSPARAGRPRPGTPARRRAPTPCTSRGADLAGDDRPPRTAGAHRRPPARPGRARPPSAGRRALMQPHRDRGRRRWCPTRCRRSSGRGSASPSSRGRPRSRTHPTG